MRTSRLSRLIPMVLVALCAFAIAGGPSTASAAARGSVTIHARTCPTDMAANADIFDTCHGNPAPDGARFKIDHRQSKYTNGAGNVSFGSATAGDHLVVLTSDWQPNEFLGMVAYCSNLGTGSGPNQATIHYGNQASFWVYVAPGSKLVCDVYFLPENAS
jgi:hypothetical protein